MNGRVLTRPYTINLPISFIAFLLCLCYNMVKEYAVGDKYGIVDYIRFMFSGWGDSTILRFNDYSGLRCLKNRSLLEVSEDLKASITQKYAFYLFTI